MSLIGDDFVSDVLEGTLREILAAFIAKYGKPSLVVVARPFLFPLTALFPIRHATTIVSLPTSVWEHDAVYIENVMYRGLFHIKEEHGKKEGEAKSKTEG